MKYLITFCLTTLLIAGCHEVGSCLREDMRQSTQLRMRSFNLYLHQHGAPGNAQKPSLEILPGEPGKNKL